jgi:hypothetical protein
MHHLSTLTLPLDAVSLSRAARWLAVLGRRTATGLPGPAPRPVSARVLRAWLTEALQAHPRGGRLLLRGPGLKPWGRGFFLEVFWLRRGKALRLAARAWRQHAGSFSDAEPEASLEGAHQGIGEHPYLTFHTLWGRCWPERVKRYLQVRAARTRRRLLALGLPVPAYAADRLGRVRWVHPEGTVAVVAVNDREDGCPVWQLVLTPDGAEPVPLAYTPREAILTAFHLPRWLDPAAVSWTELRAEIAAAALETAP